MKLRSVLPMKVAKYGYILISAVFCAAGVGILLHPSLPAAVIGRFFGVAMLAFGCIKLIGYFSKDLYRLAFEYDFQFGILLIVLGAVVLLRYESAMRFLCALFGAGMIADGLFKMRTALDARRFGLRVWWLTMALAILSAVVGLLLTFCPAYTLRAISALLGIALLSVGVLNLSIAISMVKIIRHQRPDVIDVDIHEVWEDT